MELEEIMLEIEEIKRIDRTRFTSSELQAIQGILDLYNKEKEKNKRLEEERKQFYEGEMYTAKQLKNIEKTTHKYWIHKDKIKEILDDIENNKPVIAEGKLRKLLEEE